jgi:geranylgeranyl pyrophosphate synthase
VRVTTAPDLKTWSEARRVAVDATLERLLPSAAVVPGVIHAAMRHAVFAGGKRVRPLLVLAAGEVFGAPDELLLAPAAAMELIHTFSLVHDDLPALDNDDLRRGVPTVHRAFDEATAILAGDALANLGLLVLAREPFAAAPEMRLEAVEVVAEAVGTEGMIGGQVEDLAAERGWPADPEVVLDRIHRRKTGALIVASLELGAIHGRAGRADRERIRQYGENLGLLFQLADDLLDVEGDEAAMGKAARKDAALAKLTWPALHGVAATRTRIAALCEEALGIAAALPRAGGVLGELARYVAERDR